MAELKPDEDLELENTGADAEDAPEDFEYNEDDGRNWRDSYNETPDWAKNLAKVVAGLVILLILVLVGRTIHHHLKNENQPVVSKPAAPQVAKKPGTPQTPSKQNGGGASSNGASSSTKNSGSVAANPAVGATVPDTGPGDVVAIFLGATALATVLHYALKGRRANQ